MILSDVTFISNARYLSILLIFKVDPVVGLAYIFIIEVFKGFLLELSVLDLVFQFADL